MQGTVEMVDAEGGEHLTPDEVRQALRHVDPTSAGKIRGLAQWFSFRCRIPEDDLMQEAFSRLLQGSRRVPRGEDIASVVGGVIMSLSSAEIDAIRSGRRKILPAPDGTRDNDLVDPAPSPERVVISLVDDGATLTAMNQAIEDDEELQLLFEGICDGMKGDELEELLGVSTNGLATARRRLKRRLQDFFPKGTNQ